MRHPIVISTLEEDFRRIGLLTEDKKDPEVLEIDGELAEKLQALPKELQLDEEEFSLLDEEDMEQLEILEGEELVEFMKTLRKKVGAGVKKAARKARQWYKKHKGSLLSKARKYRKTAHAKKVSKVHKAALKKLGGTKKGKIIRTARTSGMDYVANLLEQVEAAMRPAENEGVDVLRGFANVAAISDMLEDRFLEWGEHDDDLLELAEVFGKIAEDAAEVAEAMAQGVEIDEEAAHEGFQEMVSTVLNGLDVYVDITEGGALEEDDLEDPDPSDDE